MLVTCKSQELDGFLLFLIEIKINKMFMQIVVLSLETD